MLSIPAQALLTTSAVRVSSARFVHSAVYVLVGGIQATGSAKYSSSAQTITFDNPDLVYAALSFGFAAVCVVLFMSRKTPTIHQRLAAAPQPETRPGAPTAETAAQATRDAPVVSEERPDMLSIFSSRQSERGIAIGDGWAPVVVAIVIASTTAALGFAGAITGEAVATILGALVGYVVAKSQPG